MNDKELNQLKTSFQILINEYNKTNDSDCGKVANELNNLIIKYIKYKDLKNVNLTTNVK